MVITTFMMKCNIYRTKQDFFTVDIRIIQYLEWEFASIINNALFFLFSYLTGCIEPFQSDDVILCKFIFVLFRNRSGNWDPTEPKQNKALFFSAKYGLSKNQQ